MPDVLHDDGLEAAPAGGTQVPGAARTLQPEDDAYLDGLIQSGAIRISSAENGWFMLRNGTRSPVYIDHGEILCHPQHNYAFVTALRRHIAGNFDPADTVLMNVDSKSSPHVAGALATLLGFRQIIFVPDQVRQAEAGTDRQFRLPDMTGVRRVVVVGDSRHQGEWARDLVRGAGEGRRPESGLVEEPYGHASRPKSPIDTALRRASCSWPPVSTAPNPYNENSVVHVFAGTQTYGLKAAIEFLRSENLGPILKATRSPPSRPWSPLRLADLLVDANRAFHQLVLATRVRDHYTSPASVVARHTLSSS